MYLPQYSSFAVSDLSNFFSQSPILLWLPATILVASCHLLLIPLFLSPLEQYYSWSWFVSSGIVLYCSCRHVVKQLLIRSILKNHFCTYNGYGLIMGRAASTGVGREPYLNLLSSYYLLQQGGVKPKVPRDLLTSPSGSCTYTWLYSFL